MDFVVVTMWSRHFLSRGLLWRQIPLTGAGIHAVWGCGAWALSEGLSCWVMNVATSQHVRGLLWPQVPLGPAP
jgi:hypothetical protein